LEQLENRNLLSGIIGGWDRLDACDEVWELADHPDSEYAAPCETVDSQPPVLTGITSRVLVDRDRVPTGIEFVFTFDRPLDVQQATNPKNCRLTDLTTGANVTDRITAIQYVPKRGTGRVGEASVVITINPPGGLKAGTYRLLFVAVGDHSQGEGRGDYTTVEIEFPFGILLGDPLDFVLADAQGVTCGTSQQIPLDRVPGSLCTSGTGSGERCLADPNGVHPVQELQISGFAWAEYCDTCRFGSVPGSIVASPLFPATDLDNLVVQIDFRVLEDDSQQTLGRDVVARAFADQQVEETAFSPAAQAASSHDIPVRDGSVEREGPNGPTPDTEQPDFDEAEGPEDSSDHIAAVHTVMERLGDDPWLLDVAPLEAAPKRLFASRDAIAASVLAGIALHIVRSCGNKSTEGPEWHRHIGHPPAMAATW
jgi:hypothetical protein